MRTDRQTHVTKLIVAFCNSASAAKNLALVYSANHLCQSYEAHKHHRPKAVSLILRHVVCRIILNSTL